MEGITKIIGQIVTMVQDEYQLTTGLPEIPAYDYGHALEVLGRLKDLTNDGITSKEKFPAIYLFTDVPEKIDERTKRRKATVTLLIVAESQKEYTSIERTSEVFEPVLYPLYDLLMKYLNNGGLVSIDGEFDKFDRYFLGKNGIYGTESNMFNDYVDAIEIKNLSLEILKNC